MEGGISDNAYYYYYYPYSAKARKPFLDPSNSSMMDLFEKFEKRYWGTKKKNPARLSISPVSLKFKFKCVITAIFKL